MKLALSSAAAPDATLAELAAAARRRGFRALELGQGEAHQMAASSDAADTALLAEHGIEQVVCRFNDLESALQWVPWRGSLCRTVIVPAGAGRCRAAAVPGVVTAIDYADPAELAAAAEATNDSAAAFAWSVWPGEHDLECAAEAVLRATAGRLQHVRLHGGGPEAVAQEGQGVGALMRQLALAGFDGTLALAPSGPRYRIVWNAWLGRRGGWGCGSKTGGRASLPTTTLEVT